MTTLVNSVRTGPVLEPVLAARPAVAHRDRRDDRDDRDDGGQVCPDEALHDLEARAGLFARMQWMETQVATLTEALRTNRRIGIAVGILMVRLTVDSEIAFGALRQASMNGNRKLRDVAEDVIRDGILRP